MATVLLILVVVLVLAALVFGVVSLLAGDDPGLGAVEPDGRAVPLPNNRSLTETDLKTVRFDLGWRGYRMAQVDRVLRRTAYDVGYKDEMIAVLEAEVLALREGRTDDAELLRNARESAANPGPSGTAGLASWDPSSASADAAATSGAADAVDAMPADPATARSLSPDSASADIGPAEPSSAGLATAEAHDVEAPVGAGATADEMADDPFLGGEGPAVGAGPTVGAGPADPTASEASAELTGQAAPDADALADEREAQLAAARAEAATPGRLAERGRPNKAASRPGGRATKAPSRAASNGQSGGQAGANGQGRQGRNGAAGAPDADAATNGGAGAAVTDPAGASEPTTAGDRDGS